MSRFAPRPSAGWCRSGGRRRTLPALAVLLVSPLAVSACTSAGGTAARPAPPATRMSPGTAAPPPTRSAATAAPPPRLRVRVVGHLPQPVSRAVAVQAGDARVVVLGGLGAGDVTTGRVVALDVARPARVTARVAGALVEPVHDASGAWLRRHALVFGGGSASEVADVQSWTPGRAGVVGRLPQGRSDSAAVTVGTTAYVVGGFDGSRMTRDVLATRDGHRFTVAGRLPVGVRYPAVVADGGRIEVFGGQLATTESTSTGAQSDLVQRLDPASGRTRVVGHLPHSIGHAMAFTLGGRLYLAGGRHRTTATDRIWRVDLPAGGAGGAATRRRVRLVPAGRLPHPLSDSAVVQLGGGAGAEGGEVLLVGGETTGPYAPQRAILAVTTGPVRR